MRLQGYIQSPIDNGAAAVSGSPEPNSVVSGVMGSGAVTGHAGGGFFTIASGTINNSNIASGGILSGSIASGQVNE